MKRMGVVTAIRGWPQVHSSRKRLPLLLTFLLSIGFVAASEVSSGFKTMPTASTNFSKDLPVTLNKVPTVWKQHESVSISSLVSSGSCQSASSTDCQRKKKTKGKVLKTNSTPAEARSINKSGDSVSLKESSGSLRNLSVPKKAMALSSLNDVNEEVIHEVRRYFKKKRHYCKLNFFQSLPCKKLKLSMRLASEMDKNSIKLNDWVEIVKASDYNFTILNTSKPFQGVGPLYWPEKIVYRLIKSWGGLDDMYMFFKYKDFVNSHELKVSLPYKVELKVAPKLASEGSSKSRALSNSPTSYFKETARFFWDPGFNLKLKLPFFRDELKVAVSTGPSFVAGIGVGIAVLIMKSMFAPFLLGMKWMVYNVFLKESSPFDLMKMFFLSHAPSEPWAQAVPPPAIDQYRPPAMHNPYDQQGPQHLRYPRPPPPLRGRPPFHHPFNMGMKGYGPPPPHHYASPTMHGPNVVPYDMEYAPPHSPYGFKPQFHPEMPMPMPTTMEPVNPTMNQLEQLYRHQLLEEGLGFKPPNQHMDQELTNDIDGGIQDGGMQPTDESMQQNGEAQDNPSYIPSNGLQAEVEHFDPFYSPLLSKIDSIFTHLGHSDEGCRERVVCSIYKFPVKYAPYSNLISAQLSKHQTELKRPVSSSSKILRYFRYMKAAKDGQGGDNCVDLYPKCDSDTDAVSSLPMITTFHQLSELMTAEPSPPAG